MKKILLTILLTGTVFSLCAEVYWLGPGRRSGSSSDRIAALLPGIEKVLYTTSVSVNSFPTAVKVSAVRGDIEEIVLQLKKLKVDNLNVSGGTIRFERKLSDRMIERFLLVSSRKGRPLSCFRMTVPRRLPAPSEWPSELPSLPGGAEITAITRLGNNSVCGEFRNASEPAYVLLRRADAELRSRKMYAAGNEIALTTGGRGDIYFNDKAIVWVTFDGKGRGAFFYRPRK
ncbi:MAG: hypothetical protein E7048_04730 [Lentisphaerae bacterium]|nr:hypothetical protein [Lentisphaerota bacterium]MBR2872967.1 hypothetical protein [Lentisphaeria bacterium]